MSTTYAMSMATTNLKNRKERFVEDIWKHYEKDKVLGQGNFGIVHKVKHAQSKKEFALKVISKSKVVKDK